MGDNGAVNSFEELHRAVQVIFEDWGALTNCELWWRGHADESWKLKPNVYRNDAYKKNEYSMSQTFKSLANIRRDKCPANNEETSWRFLMQHYGLPTRLLDWSSSMLTALFFACNDEGTQDSDGKRNSEKHGALWSLSPMFLNESQSGNKRKEVFMGDGLKTAEHIAKEADTINGRIIAVFPSHKDIRHLIQSSRFTVHSTDNPLDSLEGYNDFCNKIIISPKGKKDILKTLRVFGVSESYLYPDLEHLASDLKRNYSV